MATTWEQVFSAWAQPPGKTEQQRIENAIKAIKNAVAKSPKLRGRSTMVFVQGSYRNRVNVRQESDVDIGVLCDDVFLTTYPEGEDDGSFGNVRGGYPYSLFKNELEEALVEYFGRDAVRRGNKAFDLHENTYRVDADVTAFFEYRRYWKDGSYRAGVALIPDTGWRVENFPERLLSDWPETPLHYENGVAKNTATGRSFKGVTRIVKNLRNAMNDEGLVVTDPIPGFLIECLVWNAPDYCFDPTTWEGRVQSVLAYVWDATRTDAACKDWCEVNDIKYLFHASQPWTRDQAHAFVDAMWTYIGGPRS